MAQVRVADTVLPAPQPAFTPCHCGQLVLTQTWVSGTKETRPHWRALPAPVDPVCGLPHQCPKEAP